MLGEMLDSFDHLLYCGFELLDAALWCLMTVKIVERVIKRFFSLRFPFHISVCTDSMGHSAEAQETL